MKTNPRVHRIKSAPETAIPCTSPPPGRLGAQVRGAEPPARRPRLLQPAGETGLARSRRTLALVSAIGRTCLAACPAHLVAPAPESAGVPPGAKQVHGEVRRRETGCPIFWDASETWGVGLFSFFYACRNVFTVPVQKKMLYINHELVSRKTKQNQHADCTYVSSYDGGGTPFLPREALALGLKPVVHEKASKRLYLRIGNNKQEEDTWP